MEAIEETRVNDLIVRIYPDHNPMNPRDWDNLATLVCWHRRYDLGDRQPTSEETDALDRGIERATRKLADTFQRRADVRDGMEVLARYLRRYAGARIVRPLGLYDHSGLTMWVGGGAHTFDAHGWDSGTVGFAYIGQERIDYLGAPNDLDWDAVLRAEVHEYDQYLTGDVYGYVIEDEIGDTLDSCWGFFGIDAVRDAVQEALTTFETD